MAIQEAFAVSFVVRWVPTFGSVRSIVSGYCQMYLVEWLTDLRCASVSRGSFGVTLTIVSARQLWFSGWIPFFSKTSVLTLGPPRGTWRPRREGDLLPPFSAEVMVRISLCLLPRSANDQGKHLLTVFYVSCMFVTVPCLKCDIQFGHTYPHTVINIWRALVYNRSLSIEWIGQKKVWSYNSTH